MVFLCKIILQIIDSGGLIVAAVIQFGACIRSLLVRSFLALMLLPTLFDSILAWRPLRNRLPTKDNLVAHDIISHENHYACLGVVTMRLLNIFFIIMHLKHD